MAKIVIAGDAIVVTSSKSLKALKTLEEYHPNALRLVETDDNGKKVEVFRVETAVSNGSINTNGATFASCTHDEAGLATITMPIPAGIENVVDYAAKTVGKAVVLLNKVEAGVDEALTKVEAEKAEVMANITVV